ncbi:unnamed protein product [Mytilus coruscus]|uniref:Uncharacterized protein n=1 Tax=Mytilus coruscus TaxID=42192 RepID=A0A6J8BKP9_MYTCO|nr:unnamed protein product [Mytilus coruscus]
MWQSLATRVKDCLKTSQNSSDPQQNEQMSKSKEDVNDSVISVKDRAKHLNKIQSESELQLTSEPNLVIERISPDIQETIKRMMLMMIHIPLVAAIHHIHQNKKNGWLHVLLENIMKYTEC